MSFFDATMRHQILLERVKLWQFQQYARVNLDLKAAVRRVFVALTVTNLTELNGTQIRALRTALQKAIAAILKKFTSSLLSFLKSLANVDRILSIAIAEAFTDSTVEDQQKRLGIVPLFGFGAIISTAALFAAIEKEPLPANGVTIEQTLAAFSDAATTAIVGRAVQGYANSETVSATVNAIVGTDKLYGRDGVLNRVMRQSRATINTTMQHVSSLSQAGVQSAFSDQYQWISIIDDKTTDVCQSRDRSIYLYATGPQPPAHPNCRSRVVPWFDHVFPPINTISEYWQSQPQSVKDRLGQIIPGKPYGGATQPLTLTQLQASLPTLLE